MLAHQDRHQRVAELRAAYRRRRLTVDKPPATRVTRPAPGAIAFDTIAVADALLARLFPRDGRLS